MPRPLVLLTVLLACVLTVGGCARRQAPALVGEGPARASSSLSPAPAEEAGDGPQARALRVLARWDQRRGRALVKRDRAAIRRLYPPGSGLADQDLALLGSYQRRGVRLVGLVRQVQAVTVRRSEASVVVLVVVDRLASAVVKLPDAGRRRLPASRYGRSLLRFERGERGWQLSSARAA